MARVYEALMLARAACPKTDKFLGEFEFAEVVEDSARMQPSEGGFELPPLTDFEMSAPLPMPLPPEPGVSAEPRAAEPVAREVVPPVAAQPEVEAAHAAQAEVADGEGANVEAASLEAGNVEVEDVPAESRASDSPAEMTQDEAMVEAAIAAAADDCLAESDDIDLDSGPEEATADLCALPPLSASAPSAPGLVPAEWREEFLQLGRVIRQLREARRLQVLAVCGAARGDGASFVTHNLSLALAEGGELRVGRFAVGASGNAGLEMVRPEPSAETFQIAIRRTPVPNIGEITTPHGGATLTQLLRGCDTGVLLQMLRQRFDLILLDLPAVTAERESAQFAAQADGVMIVAQQDGGRRSPVAEARNLLTAAGANVLGVVLNHRQEAEGTDYRQVA
jgi:Mrp family chromosome partitioning ATPase